MLRHTRHTTGFTLLELMIVVALVGIMAATVAPNLSASRADADVANAASALVRLGSAARMSAVASGLAHAVVWFPDGDGNDSVGLFRGATTRCNTAFVDWAANPISVVTASRGDYATAGVRMLPLLAGTQNIRICVQPNGQSMLRDGDGVVFTDTVNGGQNDIVFSVFPERGGVRVGAQRDVVFPAGNIPRWVQ